jgi:hypothetical protein
VSTALTIAAVVAWLGLGASAGVYWWTSQFDLESDDLFAIFLTALFGPAWWLIGAIMHGKIPRGPRVLMRRRR